VADETVLKKTQKNRQNKAKIEKTKSCLLKNLYLCTWLYFLYLKLSLTDDSDNLPVLSNRGQQRIPIYISLLFTARLIIVDLFFIAAKCRIRLQRFNPDGHLLQRTQTRKMSAIGKAIKALPAYAATNER
jgi:hypothetical protein